MANSNSRKHARKVTLDAAVSNAIEKAVDARKVAAFTVGAAGVLAGAAFAFGATPAMAAEATSAAEPAKAPVAAGDKAGTNKKDDSEVKVEAEEKASVDEKGKDAETGKSDKKDQTEANKEAGDKAENTNKQTEQPVAKTEDKKSDEEKQKQETNTTVGQDRAEGDSTSQDSNKVKPDTTDKDNTKINIDENNAETMPNAYAWGSSDNTYSVDGEKHTITFHFAKPKDGNITSIAIFPAKTNGFNNEKSEKGIDFYSKNLDKHQAYSGEYEFTANGDGSADLKMKTLFRDGNLNGGAEKYTASRSIFVYVTKAGSSTETIAYKTNVFRAVTLVPPKTSGSVVLKYNQELTPEKVQAAITEAGNIETARSDKKSVNNQLSGAFTQNINVKSDDAYDKTTFNAINTKKPGDTNSYVAGAKTLNTYMVTDLGFKSGAIPLTVARYDTHIDKPVVEDPTNVSAEVKEDIKKKLARLNNVSLDQVTINDQGEFTINFDGVDPNDAPKIALRDLVLKKLEEKDISVPAADKAVFVANPLGYSKAELERIKKSILDANKNNKDLGLTSTDQITLSYITGDITGAGKANQGISNGQAENTITVKIKTDKAVAEFTSNVKESKLTKLPNIRTDYDVSWDKTKIDGRDTDEGISWSNDQKTTIIYRYDPTKAQEFDTTKILGLLKATPKDKQAGLRDLTGGEQLAYEGTGPNPQKSHMHYALQNGEPTGELTLGNMNGPYWFGNQKVSNSDEKLGDAESEAGSYSWDTEAGPVKVAGKKGKIFKARLFVEPYAMTYYKHVYLEKDRHPGNTAKAINVIFVPQTNHKTKDLKTSVEEHKTVAVEVNEVPTQSAYYNASKDKKEAYDKALQTAKTLYDSVKGIDESKLTEDQKAEVDNATINLNKARAELDGPDTNKDGLKTSIEADGKAQEGQNPASGTQATNQFKNVSDPDFKKADGSDDTERNNAAREAKKAYDKALEDAKALKDDENATQKAVDEAKAKLDAAREKLNEFSTNKDELNNAIAQHGKVNTGDPTKTDPNEKLKTADPTYQNSTPTEQKAYDDAVAEADRVSKEPNASQKEVNDAIKKLKEAKAALDANATDKSPLDAAVKKSFDNPKPGDESQQSVFYKNAAAKKDTDPAAKKAVEDYDNALKKAKEVLANDKATKKDVEAAKKALEDAEAALHADTYQTKKTDLAKALADNFSGYLMPAYFNAFDKAQADGKDSQAAKDFKAYNDAYQAAKDLMTELNKPNITITQDKVDAVKNQLLAARKIIDTYATDTSRLSAAAFNDIAIQNSPAYKNLKELAEKQNPTQEEQAEVEAAKKAKKAYDDAAEKLHNALANKLPRDKANGHDIPDGNTPKKDGDLNDKDYLKDIQAHKNGEPLDRDVTKILQEMNDAAKALDKFATKTDELIESINKDSDTHPSPAFKNASLPSYKNDDGSDNTDKNNAAKKAVDAYGEALNKAKDLLKDPNATQAQINEAKKNLDEKRKALDAYKTDVSKLQESANKHGKEKQGETAATEGTVTSDAYRNASDPHFLKADGQPDTKKNDEAKKAKADYDKALAEAQELLSKHDPKSNTPLDAQPTQDEIDKALKTLDDARTALDAYKTNAEALKNEADLSKADTEGASIAGKFEDSPEFKNADAKKDGDNENADVAAYRKALKAARDLLAKKDATKLSERPTQQQVDEALDALKKAKQTITDSYKTNATALQDEAALGANDGNFTKSPEYKNAEAKKAEDGGDNAELKAYKAALTEVKTMLNNFGPDGKPKKNVGNQDLPTQAQVDAALKNLSDARKAVEAKYATKTNKLENEVGDKDETGQPVTPPFEASVPYKNALAKKNDGDTTATEKLKAYADKLAEAQKLIDQVNNPDPNAAPEDRPTQKQVDDALEALKKAKKDIDDAFKTNAAALKKETKELKDDGSAKDEKDKFEKSTEYQNALAKTDADSKKDVQTYQDALKKANELLELFGEDGNPKADIPAGKQIPTQQEVDAAQKALKEIKDKILANYKTSPNDLYKEVDKSKDGDTDTSTDVFENTPAFKNADAAKDGSDDNADMKAYKEALKAAKAMLEKFDRATGKPKDGATDVPTQAKLDAALKALQDAKKKIEDKYSTVKYDLRQEAGDDFTKSPEYQNAQAKGDDASKQALEDYKNALDEANSVLADPNATQAQVDAALKRLQDAKSKLKAQNSTDKSKLQAEADDDANFRNSPYFIIGNKADIEAYENALAEAKSVLNDPNATQAQVDAALRKLQAAKAALLNSLSGASGHKIAKTGAATGLFAGFAAIFAGLGAAGVASRRRKHSNE